MHFYAISSPSTYKPVTTLSKSSFLITPDVESGNILAKALAYFAKGHMAGVVVGAKCPIVMPSRSDPPEQKLMSLALGVYLTK